jgi:hypothetical protein
MLAVGFTNPEVSLLVDVVKLLVAIVVQAVMPPNGAFSKWHFQAIPAAEFGVGTKTDNSFKLHLFASILQIRFCSLEDFCLSMHSSKLRLPMAMAASVLATSCFMCFIDGATL